MDYQRAIEIEPGNADGYRRLGYVYGSINRLSEALTTLRQAIEIEPKYSKTYQGPAPSILKGATIGMRSSNFAKKLNWRPANRVATSS